MPKQKKKEKRFLIAKLLRIYNVRRLSVKLPHECENIAKNAWRTPLNALRIVVSFDSITRAKALIYYLRFSLPRASSFFPHNFLVDRI